MAANSTNRLLRSLLGHCPLSCDRRSGKPAGVLGISVGAVGTAVAQQHLRTILAYLDVPTLGQPEVFIQMRDGLFDADGSIGAASRKFLQVWTDRYVAWIRKHPD